MANLFKHVAYIILIFCLQALMLKTGSAQNYHAIGGSTYAGSLGISNNPSTIVNCPYKWDITLFGSQAKWSSNAIAIHNYSLLSSARRSLYEIKAGSYSRYADLNFNIHLLNARIAIGRKQAIAFGMNLRGYGNVKTGTYNFIDTLQNMNNFFRINEATSIYQGRFTSSSWIELFGTYSLTILDRETGRLNAGATIKIARGISGAYAQLQNGSVNKIINDTASVYLLNTGNARYGYSYNYDSWQNNKTTKQNIRDFINNARGAFSLDLGLEYIVKTQAVTNYDDADSYYDYEWKFGVALLDIGYNQYKYGKQSRLAANPRQGVADFVLDQKFDSVANVAAFNDSLSGIVNSISPAGGKFIVSDPTRLVLTVNKSLDNNFFINGEVSINLFPSSATRLHVQEINLVTLTPAWETRKWGVYLPLQYNTNNQFWIGGALRAGPLLIGIHNWSNLLSKNKMQNGGAYIALVIRSRNNISKKEEKQYQCPK